MPCSLSMRVDVLRLPLCMSLPLQQVTVAVDAHSRLPCPYFLVQVLASQQAQN